MAVRRKQLHTPISLTGADAFEEELGELGDVDRNLPRLGGHIENAGCCPSRSLPRVATKRKPRFQGFLSGPARTRTWDQGIMSPLL